MRWFVEEKTFKGTWSPAIYYSKEPPSEKGLSSSRTFRKPPIALPPEHNCLSFREVVDLYGVKEEA
jgi:hypothetical protein